MTSQNDSPDRSSKMISDDAKERVNSEGDNAGQNLSYSADEITVENEVIREYVAKKSRGWSDSTVKTYSIAFRHYIEFEDHFIDGGLMEATQDDLQKFFRHCVVDQEHRKSTVELRKTALGGFYEHCQIQDEYDPEISKIHVIKALTPDILELCPDKIERKPISREELNSLLDNAGSGLKRLIIQFTYETGARNNDVRDLRVQDVSLDDGTVEFRNSKGGTDYVVPIRTELVIKLRQWIQNGRKAYLDGRENDYLFPGKYSPQLRRWQGLIDIVDEAAQNAGIQEVIATAQSNTGDGEIQIKRVTPHTLRHSIITHLSNDNVDLKYRQLLAGHSSPNTTEQVYTHDDDSAFDILRENID